jgi:aromatic-L-amino-acid decarboxylase
MAATLAGTIRTTPDFELLAPVPLNLICFRYHPAGTNDIEALNRLNASLMERLNATGKLFLTHTKLNGAFAIRMVIGQTHVQQRHVDAAWDLIRSMART